MPKPGFCSGADWLDGESVCSYAGRMATDFDSDPADFGSRLDRWRQGETVARIIWIDSQGTEHEDVIDNKREALDLLDMSRRYRP